MDKLEQIKTLVQEWVDKQGHNRCWYYPDIFNKIAEICEVKIPEPDLPAREEFEEGCKKYQDEQFRGCMPGSQAVFKNSMKVNEILSKLKERQ